MSGITTFNSDKEFLHDLLKSTQEGKTQLPDFQRRWVWDDERIKSILASVSLAFPIGAIMTMLTGNEDIRFMPRPIEGVDSQLPQFKKQPDRLILDGQQRLTAFYQSLYSNNAVSTKDVRGRPIERWYYIDMKKALDMNVDREETIRSVPGDRIVKYLNKEIEDYSTPEKEYEADMFPLCRIFDNQEWRSDYYKFWNYNSEKIKLFDDFERTIITRFVKYQIPIIELGKETPKEAVCQVFEKVNTGGVSLTVFELLTATFAADDFNLLVDWNKRSKRFKQHTVLSKIENTDYLQTVCLLSTYHKRLQSIKQSETVERAPAVSCKRKDILRLELGDYKARAEAATKGFENAAKFLRTNKIFGGWDIPYKTQLVPLASMLAVLGDEAEKDSVKSKISRWYWCGVLGELYGSAIETRFAKDLLEVVAWIRGEGPEPATIADANFFQSRLYTLKTRNSAAYKGIYALLMRDGCLDFRTGDPIEVQTYFDESIDIHHIFPKKWCQDNKVSGNYQDCIVNKTAISAKTNRIIGGHSTSYYLSRLENDGIDSQRLDEILRSHRIDAEALRNDDFDIFFKKREEALLQRIEEAMGKPAVRESSMHYAEEVAAYPEEENAEEII